MIKNLKNVAVPLQTRRQCDKNRFLTSIILTNAPRRLAFLLVAATLAGNCASLGCANWKIGQNRPRIFPLFKRAEKPVDSLSGAQTILTVDGRVERLQVSADSKRIIVERRDFAELTANDRAFLYDEKHNNALKFENFDDDSSFSAFNNGTPSNYSNDIAFLNDAGNTVPELWNVEYGEARPEPFGAETNVESTTFDADGDRVFWTARRVEPDRPDAAENVFATRALEPPPLAPRNENATAPQKLKTAPEMRAATAVRLSPNARWLICRDDGAPSNDAPSAHFLVLRSDRRRVVRFPDVVKMTFASSTSDETIEGRVVETLAVSDAGDLVATLIEELPPKSNDAASETKNVTSETLFLPSEFELETTPNPLQPTKSAQSAFSPRYKIAIWDLSVAEKVDWEKAKKPLKPLEVAQIPINRPVSRHFCKFSPNGRLFAARLDPRYIEIWQAADGKLFTELGEHKNSVDDFTFSPNGMQIAAGCGGKQARIVLWELRKSAPLRILDDYSEGVTAIDAVAYAPDGRRLYFANNFGEIKRWETRAQADDSAQ